MQKKSPTPLFPAFSFAKETNLCDRLLFILKSVFKEKLEDVAYSKLAEVLQALHSPKDLARIINQYEDSRGLEDALFGPLWSEREFQMNLRCQSLDYAVVRWLATRAAYYDHEEKAKGVIPDTVLKHLNWTKVLEGWLKSTDKYRDTLRADNPFDQPIRLGLLPSNGEILALLRQAGNGALLRLPYKLSQRLREDADCQEALFALVKDEPLAPLEKRSLASRFGINDVEQVAQLIGLPTSCAEAISHVESALYQFPRALRGDDDFQRFLLTTIGGEFDKAEKYAAQVAAKFAKNDLQEWLALVTFVFEKHAPSATALFTAFSQEVLWMFLREICRSLRQMQPTSIGDWDYYTREPYSGRSRLKDLLFTSLTSRDDFLLGFIRESDWLANELGFKNYSPNSYSELNQALEVLLKQAKKLPVAKQPLLADWLCKQALDKDFHLSTGLTGHFIAALCKNWKHFSPATFAFLTTFHERCWGSEDGSEQGYRDFVLSHCDLPLQDPAFLEFLLDAYDVAVSSKVTDASFGDFSSATLRCLMNHADVTSSELQPQISQPYRAGLVLRSAPRFLDRIAQAPNPQTLLILAATGDPRFTFSFKEALKARKEAHREKQNYNFDEAVRRALLSDLAAKALPLTRLSIELVLQSWAEALIDDCLATPGTTPDRTLLNDWRQIDNDICSLHETLGHHLCRPEVGILGPHALPIMLELMAARHSQECPLTASLCVLLAQAPDEEAEPYAAHFALLASKARHQLDEFRRRVTHHEALDSELITKQDLSNELDAYAKMLFRYEGPYKALKPLLLLFRSLNESCVTPGLGVDRQTFWYGLPEAINAILLSTTRTRKDDNDKAINQLRRLWHEDLVERLKPKRPGKNGDIERAPLPPDLPEAWLAGWAPELREPHPVWRRAYCEAAADLRVNPQGKGHYILAKVAEEDPDADVRDAARRAAKRIREIKTGVREDISPKTAVFNAWWWLRLAHFVSLNPGLDVDMEAAKITRSKEVRQ